MSEKHSIDTQTEDFKEIAVDLTMYIMSRDGEAEQETLERLLDLLDSEMCNLADHHISYQVYRTR